MANVAASSRNSTWVCLRQPMVVSTLELPFGVTNAPATPELAALGIREFCEAKSVWRLRSS